MPSASAAKDELTLLRELVSALQAALEETKNENALLRQKVEALIDPGQQILRSLAALPAGTDFCAAAQRQFATANP